MRKASYGFTIVELLVVVVVIAILAAISVVAYQGIQDRAKVSAHKYSAAQVERQIMAFALDENSESISLGGSLIGYVQGIGEVQLLQPISGMADITMYTVYEVTNTAGGYTKFAKLTPSSNTNGFMFQTGLPGSSSMSYRIDTPSQTSLGNVAPGYRVPGNVVIGWLRAASTPLGRAFGYNQAPPSEQATLSTHAGWNFTGAETYAASDGEPKALLVFNAAHDEAIRSQIIEWLADEYGVSL